MENTYWYEIQNLIVEPKKDGFNNVVVEVIYTYNGADESNQTNLGSTVLTLEFDSENFIDFNNLQEQQVIFWLTEKNVNSLNIMNTDIDYKLKKMKEVQPVQIIATPPWKK